MGRKKQVLDVEIEVAVSAPLDDPASGAGEYDTERWYRAWQLLLDLDEQQAADIVSFIQTVKPVARLCS